MAEARLVEFAAFFVAPDELSDARLRRLLTRRGWEVAWTTSVSGGTMTRACRRIPSALHGRLKDEARAIAAEAGVELDGSEIELERGGRGTS
jgi:hypothetical protein